MTLLTLLTNQPSAQTIVLDRLESTAQIYLPTIIQGGAVQTIVLNTLASTAQVYLPTISLLSGVIDTSDILDKGAKRRKQAKEEENIAAQILLKRRGKPQQKVVKQEVNWKELFLERIDGIQNEAQLDEIVLPDPDENLITKQGITEIEQFIKIKRLELQNKLDEIESAYIEAYVAQKKAIEFTRKREQRNKRLKALMWLAKLDL